MTYCRYLILLFLIPISCWANNVRFNHFTTENGLSQNVINAIAQDEQGFLWFATQNGLNRFDGFTFEQFFVRTENATNGLTANYIRTLYFQAPHYLWIGYDTHGVSRFNLKSGEIDNLDLSQVNQSADSNVIHKIIECNGNIWIATYAGIAIINQDNVQLENMLTINSELANKSVNTVFKDQNNNCYAGNHDGLYLFSNTSNTFNKVIGQLNVTDIFQANSGAFWLGTSKGVFEYSELKPQIKVAPIQKQLDEYYITDITQLPTGDIWVATRTSGIFTFNIEKSTWQQIKHKPNAPSSLRTNNINEIFIDAVNNIWVASVGGGSSQLSFSKQSFGHINNEFFDIKFNNDVRAIKNDKNGYTWLGTSKGLYRWNRTNNTIANAERLNLPDYFANHFITFIHFDRRDFMWIGTLNNGVFKAPYNSNTFKQYIYQENEIGSFPGTRALNIHEDKLGNIWIGTYYNGLAKYSTETDSFTATKQGNTEQNLSHNKVSSILEDDFGRIWTSTHGQGLNILNKTSLKVIKITKASHGIIDDVINSMAKDDNGKIWLATDMGLSMIDSRTYAVKNFDKANGLPDNTLYSLQLDLESNLWIGTNSGLVRFNTTNKEITSFNEQDGIQHREFNTTAKTIDEQGRVYLGGLNGINHFLPQEINSEKTTPDVIISQFYLQNAPLKSKAWQTQSPLLNRASYSDSLTVKTSDLLDIHFSALNVTNPKNLYFYYRLLPLDTNWYLAKPGDNSASYYRLSQGDYQFEVKTTHHPNSAFSEIKPLMLTVKAPWWQTYFAYSIYFIIVVLIVSFILLLQFRKRQAELNYFKEVEESQQRLSLALWGSGDNLWHWNINKDEMIREKILKDKTISTRSSFSLNHLESIIHPDDLERVKKRLLQTLRGNIDLYQADYRIKNDENQWTWVLDRGQVSQFDKNNKAIEIVGTTQNISELKHAQLELAALNAELEQRVELRTQDLAQSNQKLANTIKQLELTSEKLIQMEKMSALTNLVCGIAHEINTPLSIAKTSLSLLQHQADDLVDNLSSGKLSREKFENYQENYSQANKLCQDNINKAITLINEFKRISVRDNDYVFSELHLEKVIQQLMDKYQEQAQSKHVKLEWQQSKPIVIYSSTRAIHDVLTELFDNSFKYAFTEATTQPTISLKVTKQTNEYVILEYKDNGQGISGIASDKVFDAFSADALTSGGLGIGLNMASNIMVSILDSEISLIDQEKGVCFRLIFKLNQHLD